MTTGGVNAINVAPQIIPARALGVPARIPRRPVPYFISVLGDEGGFVHKRIFRGIKGAVGGLLSGGPLGIIGGALGGFLGPGKQPAELAQQGCPPGFSFDGRGCVPTGFLGQALRVAPPVVTTLAEAAAGVLVPRGRPIPQRGISAGVPDQFGEMVSGQFGAGLEPAIRDTMTRICPRGAVLGKDGLCYNKRDIPNSQREWPRGRRPLLTGGEMRAISIAASAAKKLQRKQKQLMSLGLLKRPAVRRARALPAGHHAHVAHDGGSDH